MTLNVASVNMRALRDPSKYARLLGELSNLCVVVVTGQKTNFICAADSQVLAVISAYSCKERNKHSCINK